ncbi:MAG: molybdate ABC transporter permease subunit [Lachnospiraceae bacterium]|nr:molybdate ABC transporter permease subunit [Lachnospiraceae bacterium]
MDDWSPLWISVQVAFLATVCSVILGTALAYGVMNLKKLRPLADAVLTLPLVLPPTVVGFFLLILLGKNSVIGQFFNEIGLPFIFTMRGAVAAAFVVSFPLMYRSARGAMEQMDRQLLYAARTLGANEGKIFFRVILPNCRSGIFAGTILAFARAMGEFGATIMLAGNIPGKTQTMALAVYTAVQGGNREEAFQWAVIIVLMSAAAILAINYFEQGKNRGKDDTF